MPNILFAIAPIFILILLGHLLRRGGIPSIAFWNLNDKLVYWVLFPPFLFYKMATMDLSTERFSLLSLVIYAGFVSAVLFGLVAGRLLRMKRPLWTSVLQGCARHNTFIALAVADRLFGAEGIAIAAIITALLIPVTNVSVVSLMVIMLSGRGQKSVFMVILRDLARNPILIAVVLGIAINFFGVQYIPVVYDIAVILGGAALPIVLLSVGANIRVRAMKAVAVPTLLAVSGKMVLFPVVVGLMAYWVGLDVQSTLIAILFGAVPSAAGSYTLARQMGGDAPAMAAIVTIQTGVSFVTLPMTLLIAQHYLGPARVMLS